MRINEIEIDKYIDTCNKEIRIWELLTDENCWIVIEVNTRTIMTKEALQGRKAYYTALWARR